MFWKRKNRKKLVSFIEENRKLGCAKFKILTTSTDFIVCTDDKDIDKTIRFKYKKI